MKLQQLLLCLLLTGSVGVLVAMPALADVLQVTDVPLHHFTSDIEVILQTEDDAAPADLTASEMKS